MIVLARRPFACPSDSERRTSPSRPATLDQSPPFLTPFLIQIHVVCNNRASPTRISGDPSRERR